MGIEGKSVVITGGTGNLGSVVTRRFLGAGAMVTIPVSGAGGIEALKDDATARDRLSTVTCDVLVEAQVEALMAAAHERYGGPHVLLNLVGGYAPGAKVMDLDEAAWDRMLALNLKSVFLCTKHALRYMTAQDYGRIVSVSAKVAVDTPARAAAYAVAKEGVVTFTKCLAREVRGTGVAVSAIMPSVIDTPANRESQPDADFSKWVSPDAIADVLLWLASDEAGAANGAIVPLFGGM